MSFPEFSFIINAGFYVHCFTAFSRISVIAARGQRNANHCYERVGEFQDMKYFQAAKINAPGMLNKNNKFNKQPLLVLL
jgi:hypothetical protein